MLKREALFRVVVLALCAALSLAPGGVWVSMPDEAFAVLCGEGAGEEVKQALAEGVNAMARATP